MRLSPVEMKTMKRVIHRALVALSLVSPVSPVSLVSPVFADVTMKATITGKGMGQSGSMNSTTYIKGNKMRSDVVMGDTTRTTIFDIDTQKMISFDS